MNKKTGKPTILNFLTGIIISLFKEIFNKNEKPGYTQIGKYKLIKIFNRNTSDYSFGEYEFRNKRFFIKTYHGRFKDYSYYCLLNESFINKFLSEKFNKTKNTRAKYEIRIVDIIEVISTSKSLSVVFEYIKGEKLSLFDIQKQKDIIAEIIFSFHKLSKKLTKRERSNFQIRSRLFYIFTLPVVSFLTFIFSPKSGLEVLKKLVVTYTKISHLFDGNRLTISHRDLDENNILIDGNNVYLIDCGRMVLTIPNYDLTYLSLNPYFTILTKAISEKLNIKVNEYLNNYILIHYAKPYKKNTDYFFTKLYEK